jgi:Spirocyclase AveC-like
MAVIEDRVQIEQQAGRAVDLAPPKSKPVVAWATLGCGFIALQVYLLCRWVFGSHFHSIGTGVTPVPDYMKIAVHGTEAVMAVGIPVMIYQFVVRPLRRNGRLSLDGLLILAFFWVWWQDPLFNYVTTGFNNGSIALNMGGWASYIPGWNSPNGGRIPEGIMWDLGFYLVLCAGGAIGATALMKQWRARRPTVRTSTMFFAVFCAYVVGDLVIEMFFVRTGFYSYAGAARGWTIFTGRFYQFPMYEPFVVATLVSGWTAVRYFVNDRGESVAERGAAELRAGTRSRTLVRFLGLVGVLNLVFLAGYSIPIQLWQLHPGPWPKSVQERSYLVNGICGAGTTFACPGPGIASPRADRSIHVGPNGQLAVPRGTVIPREVPFAK